MALDASGSGVAVWARVVGSDREDLDPADAPYRIEAVTIRADGAWSPPETLGETHSNPTLDLTASGEAVIAWGTGTLKGGQWHSRELLAARKPAGGRWSPPEVVSRQQLAQVDGDLQQPVGFYDFRVVLEPPSARLTAAWRTASLGPGEQPYMLQAATRAPSGPWLAPVTIDPRKDFGSPVFLGADGRGEVYAIWLGEPRPDSNDVELRAATRGTDGIWSPPAALARATAGIPYEQMALKGAVTSPSGQLFVLVARNDQHPTRPTHSRRSVQAFTRTPDHVWSGPDTVARSKWRSQRHCISGDLAMLDQERALAIWSCRAGGAGRKVRVAALVP